MNTCTLKILDQVNVKFDGLDPGTRRRICNELKFFIPYARHTPQFKLGRWDGTISYASVGGGTYLNLLDRVLPIVIDSGYEIELEDSRTDFDIVFPEISEDMISDKTWPEGHVFAGESIILRDYQVEAIKNFTENLQSIQSISTGAGKTLITAVLSLLCEQKGRTIVIVPSKSLVEQTEEDYKNLGLDVGVFFGDRKEWNHKHTICTWQSLSVFSKKSKRQEIDVPISEFIEDVVCVMVDECHQAKANEIKELMTGPFSDVPIRWGLTGTIPKEEYDFFSLLLSIGPVVGEIKAADLQEKGVLANCKVNIIQLKDDDYEFETYDKEKEYLLGNKDRLDFIAKFSNNVAQSGNTLILVDRIETGEYLSSLIKDSVFISGKVKTKDRKAEYKEVQTTNDKIIIATYGVAAVGINIPRIFNLILLEPGKSFVRVIQSIGRGIRKAMDKDYLDVYDVCSTLKYSKRHLSKRKSYYKEANYPFELIKTTFK